MSSASSAIPHKERFARDLCHVIYLSLVAPLLLGHSRNKKKG